MINFPAYTNFWGKLAKYLHVIYALLVLVFLIIPIIVIIPLSFNSEPYFTYPMPGLSLKWYEAFFTSPVWINSLKNTLLIGVISTLIATILGIMASLGLMHPRLQRLAWLKGMLMSPMIVPLIITAVGVYFAFSPMGLSNSLLGLILAHSALGVPFVIVTVTATLAGFNDTLSRAGRILGATPLQCFFKVKLPLIAPGVISGALFAFATSFDEIVVAIFLTSADQRTVPRQMWSGIREQLSPTILAVATILIVMSTIMLITLELLRRRTERIRTGSL